MKNLLALLLAGVGMFLAGCVQSRGHALHCYDFKQIQQVAIIDVCGAVSNENAKNVISDSFGLELLRKGYSPILRRQAQCSLESKVFSLETNENIGCTAKMLNAEAILLVDVPEYGNTVRIDATLISSDGKLLWQGGGSKDVSLFTKAFRVFPSGRCKDEDLESDKIRVAKEIIKNVACSIPLRCK